MSRYIAAMSSLEAVTRQLHQTSARRMRLFQVAVPTRIMFCAFRVPPRQTTLCGPVSGRLTNRTLQGMDDYGGRHTPGN